MGICSNSSHWVKGREWYKEDCLLPQYSSDKSLVENLRKAAEDDYLTFLKYREKEFKENGLFLLNGPCTKNNQPAMYAYLWKAWESFVNKHNIQEVKKYLYLSFYFRTEEELRKPFDEKLVKFEIIHFELVDYVISQKDRENCVGFCKPLIGYFLSDVIENK